MISRWIEVIPEGRGGLHSTANGTIMTVQAGPGDMTFKSTDHTALITTVPIEKQVSFETDRVFTTRDGAGTFRLLQSGARYRSSWQTTSHGIGCAISPERLQTIGEQSFVSVDTEFRITQLGVIDKKVLLISRFIQDELKQLQPERIALESLQIIFWVHLLREYSARRTLAFKLPTGGLTPYTLKRIDELIRGNLKNVSLTIMADEADLSESHFLRAFRTSMGLAPHQYVIERRLERAAELIRENEYMLSMVADICGFSSQSHMTALMRKHWGLTPKQLRQ